MQITYSCPRCDHLVAQSFDDKTREIQCSNCQSAWQIADSAVEGQEVRRCLVCPSVELFVRKDFPQRLGVGIVVFGFALSCLAWYHHLIITTFAILFATALIDVVLFVFVGDLLECYRCHAQYRGVADLDQHGSFDLEVHEKYRQQQARLKQSDAAHSGS